MKETIKHKVIIRKTVKHKIASNISNPFNDVIKLPQKIFPNCIFEFYEHINIFKITFGLDKTSLEFRLIFHNKDFDCVSFPWNKSVKTKELINVYTF